jgi:hypothetical protein
MYVALLPYLFASFLPMLTQPFVKIIAQFSTCTLGMWRMREESLHSIFQPSLMISIEEETLHARVRNCLVLVATDCRASRPGCSRILLPFRRFLSMRCLLRGRGGVCSNAWRLLTDRRIQGIQFDTSINGMATIMFTYCELVSESESLWERNWFAPSSRLILLKPKPPSRLYRVACYSYHDSQSSRNLGKH